MKENLLTTTIRRNQSLDILRFIAVFLVIGRHFPPLGENCSSSLYKIGELWTRGGWVGVDLFFVLSGFLVSGLLFSDYKKNDSLSIGRFYIRRGFKIYPAFYFFFITTLIVWLVFNPQAISKLNIFAEVVFLQNYIGGIWWHTWSLAVEEHFYFILPVVLLLILKYKKSSRDPFRPIVPITIAVCILLLILRIANGYYYSWNPPRFLTPTHLRIDSLLFGVLISYFYHFHRSVFDKFAEKYKPALFIAGLCLLIPAFVFELETTPFIYTFGFALFYLGSGALLCAAISSKVLDSHLLGIFGYVGSHSYSVYLWHAPVMQWGILIICKKIFGNALNCTLIVALTVILSFVVGIVAAKIIEMPFLKIRDRFFPSKNLPPIEVKQ